MEIISVTHAYGRALWLSIGEKASDYNIRETQRRSPLPGFDSSKKCEHHFGAEGHTLKECIHLRHRIQDLIDKKLVQFDNTVSLNVIINPLPPY